MPGREPADLTRQSVIDDLDDHAFVMVREGGQKDAEGKTFPRVLRIGPHHQPSLRRLVFDISPANRRMKTEAARDSDQDKTYGTLDPAAVARVAVALNAGRYSLSADERMRAWKHIEQHAKELRIELPPRRF